VKISAYKTLGSFIATFLRDSNDEASTIKTKEQSYNEQSKTNAPQPQQQQQQQQSQQQQSQSSVNSNNNDEQQQLNTAAITNNKTTITITSTLKVTINNDANGNGNNAVQVIAAPFTIEEAKEQQDHSAVTALSKTIVSDKEEKESGYSNFMYWRNTLPSLDNETTSNTSTSAQSESASVSATSKPSDESSAVTDTSQSSNEVASNKIDSGSFLQSLVNAKLNSSNQSLKFSFVSSPSSSTIEKTHMYSSTSSLNVFASPQIQQQSGEYGQKLFDMNRLSEELKQVALTYS
jgi:hypothetical protein